MPKTAVSQDKRAEIARLVCNDHCWAWHNTTQRGTCSSCLKSADAILAILPTPPADMEGAVAKLREIIGFAEANAAADPDDGAWRAHARNCRDVLAAVSALQRTPPDGWKTVPIELTEHMRDVAWSLIQGNLRPDEIWKYMVEAAPAAPVLAEKRGE